MCNVYIMQFYFLYIYTLTRYMTLVRYAHIIKKGEIIPKTKKFGCMGRGDLTFLFKSCEIDISQGKTRVLRVDRQACNNFA